MGVGILTTRNQHYHPNRRYIETALSIGIVFLKGVGDRIELSDVHTYGAVQSAEVLEMDVAGVDMLK